MSLTAIIEQEGDGYVALCPELDIASQGDSVDEARDSLTEALELFLEAASHAEIRHRLHDAEPGRPHTLPVEISWPLPP